MWFMQFPIDAAFLDNEMRILKISRNLKPWQLAFAPLKTHCVLETSAHTMKDLRTGDQLIISSE